MLRFEQGKIHEEYIYHLYKLFKDYCQSKPKYRDQKPESITGKIYKINQFKTRSLLCFNEFHSMFYIYEGNKFIPSNIG
jgi:LAGLIDADG DNA endonuclease family